MASVVFHIVFVLIILDFIRHYFIGKKHFPKYLLIIGGLIGAFPDIDVPLGWIYNFLTGSTIDLHGMFTHSIIFPMIFLLMCIFFYFQKKINLTKIFFIIAVSWTIHLLLDCPFGGYGGYLWPLSINTSTFCIKIWKMRNYPYFIDGAFLLLWLIHDQAYNYFKKIRKKDE
ncbi:MAG: metal-dependent hydrolase [Candidatus Hodarchaeota archaeon]